MTISKIDYHKQCISEILAGDFTNANDFMSDCLSMAKAIALCSNYRFDHNWSIEDFCQDACYRALLKLPKFNPEYAFSTWFSKLCANIYYRHFNNMKKAMDIVSLDDKDNESGMDKYEKYTGGDSVEELYFRINGNVWAKVFAAMKDIPENYYNAMNLVYIKGKSVKEAADTLNATLCQVNNWLARGRKKMYDYCTENKLQSDLIDELEL